MEVIIRPKNFKLSSTIESQIRKRLERLPRHLDNLQLAEVVLSQEPTKLTAQRFQYVAQLTLHTSHNLLRSEVSDPELLTAVDQGLTHLDRQIERYKGRLYKRHKGAVGVGKSSAEAASKGASQNENDSEQGARLANGSTKAAGKRPAAQEEANNIVRVKRFSVKPMFPEEAIEQMELLGHTFYVFWNATQEKLSVVYRRDDGDYGLIEPEMS